MAIDKDSFFKYHEDRAQTGYRAAIVVKEQTASLYSLLVASETVPSVFGTQDSFEFDLLNSPSKGKVGGKMTLEDKEVEVLHHRDNVVRFEDLKGKVLDFMYIDSQFVGYKFSGTLSYRVNDATADVLRGTYTITPISADPTPILDVSSLLQETVCFEPAIPDFVELPTASIDVSVVQATSTLVPTFSVQEYAPATKSWSVASTKVTTTNGRSTYTGDPGNAGKLIKITASLTGYAPWSTTIKYQ